jgi:hypothetical protein
LIVQLNGFFQKVFKFTQDLGFKTKVYNTDLADIKMAIFSDPNGLEVRIMELKQDHLGEENSSRKTVF